MKGHHIRFYGEIYRDYYMGFLLSPDLSAKDSNIGPMLV